MAFIFQELEIHKITIYTAKKKKSFKIDGENKKYSRQA